MEKADKWKKNVSVNMEEINEKMLCEECLLAIMRNSIPLSSSIVIVDPLPYFHPLIFAFVPDFPILLSALRNKQQSCQQKFEKEGKKTVF